MSAEEWGGGVADALEQQFRLLSEPSAPGVRDQAHRLLQMKLLSEICDALEGGHLRIVDRGPSGEWRVHGWIRRALVELASAGRVEQQPGVLPGSELDSLGWVERRPLSRRVPAGSFVRRGVWIAEGVTIMPPSVVQAGAWIESGVSIDSHALVGSAAWLGERAVVGAGVVLGGVLLPEDALPVIVEPGAVIGGGCGLYGSMVIGRDAQVFAGTVIRSAGGAFLAAEQRLLLPDDAGTLHIPPGAQVQMGVPPANLFRDGIAKVMPVIV